MENEEEKLISRFNSGWAQNVRLDLLWKLVNKFAFARQLSSWNDMLDRIWSELAGDLDMNNEKDKGKLNKYLEFNKELDDTDYSLENVQSNGFVQSYDNNKDMFKKHREILMRKEQSIRHFQNDMGKGTAYKNPNEDDWE